MKCSNHPEVEAIAACVKCHKPLCGDCRVKVNERNFCSECAEKPGFKIDKELKELEKFPSDVVKAAGRADDYLKEKGVHEEVDKFKKKSSEMFKSISKNINDNSNGKKRIRTVKKPLEEIKKAKELLDMGAITEKEFEEIKHKYLKQM
jgi:hypothetical protein